MMYQSLERLIIRCALSNTETWNAEMLFEAAVIPYSYYLVYLLREVVFLFCYGQKKHL